jgi:carboxypeptidase T
MGHELVSSGVMVQPASQFDQMRAMSMTRYRITISGSNKSAMLDLLRKFSIDVSDHGVRFAPDVGFTVTAFAASDEIEKLRRAGYHVVQHEDADEAGKACQEEVGRGNRYTGSAQPPSPPSVKGSTTYLNIDEVESALAVAAAAPYANIATLITLPNPTHEGRTCHALKISGQSGANRVGVYFLGGVHAREWGSPDILINFIERIEQAYVTATGLAFGGTTFTAADIKKIVDTLDILIFPQANPDGRQYSMTVDCDWRKNRRPASAGTPQCIGVDLNRNFDFLWDFPKHYSPEATVATSTEPCNDFYFGTSSFSEPETKNARWIVDQFAGTRFFIDLHSYGQQVLYRWGNDEDQSDNPAMNFMNPDYDGDRGVDDSYKEYIPAGDLSTSTSLGKVLQSAIKAVRGTDYNVGPSYNLYPSSGTSDDYFYSRHFTDASKPKIISFTVEWGKQFYPPYAEMAHIIDEVTVGLLAFCLKVANLP